MSAASFVVVVAAAFCAMEPVTAATHRFVMHGIGRWFHRSHHRPRVGTWERNDWYPVMFAAIVMFGLWLGFQRESLEVLIPIGVGVTAYGAAYAFVHDGYIHGRVRWIASRRSHTLRRLADAHRIHHLYGAAPYGMLVPMVPGELRARAASSHRDPLARSARAM